MNRLEEVVEGNFAYLAAQFNPLLDCMTEVKSNVDARVAGSVPDLLVGLFRPGCQTHSDSQISQSPIITRTRTDEVTSLLKRAQSQRTCGDAGLAQ